MNNAEVSPTFVQSGQYTRAAMLKGTFKQCKQNNSVTQGREMGAE